MYRIKLQVYLFTLLALCHTYFLPEIKGDELREKKFPIRIIIDTDMDTDCDDAGALAMLHTFADKKEVVILATIVSSRYPWSAPCVEAINSYRGRPNIPIGVPKCGGASIERGSKYARQIAKEFDGLLKTNDDAPSAVAIYRRTLEAAPGNSVTIVTIGYLTNLSHLLLSKADIISDLDGVELIKTKVDKLVCMGGRYPEHLDPRVFGNFKPDPYSAVMVARNWPGIIYFSGLGEDIHTGQKLKQTPTDNPVRRAYELFFLHAPPSKNYLRRAYEYLFGQKIARPSWDQVAVLFAVRPNEPIWKLRTKGHNHIYENGTNQWRDTPDKNHILVDFASGVKIKVRNIIESIMTESPNVN